jgi:formamidopyrimidine-DNA glycosylase
MPELPEVETTRRGLLPQLQGRRITSVVLRREGLRWPFPTDLSRVLQGATIVDIQRRAKYLLVDLDRAERILLHLGMSGVLRTVPHDTPLRPHDHADLVLDGPLRLRFHDPRRFGCMDLVRPDQAHPLLADLGPEPLSADFHGDYLYGWSRDRRSAVKPWIMDQRTVVGVGNIYAAEALHAAGIDPRRAAGRISRDRYARLATEIKRILAAAIERGGTTLRDFLSPEGLPGYFEQELLVYGRGGEACKHCGSTLREGLLGQRASVWCPSCQR